jgi:hypothetical protein
MGRIPRVRRFWSGGFCSAEKSPATPNIRARGARRTLNLTDPAALLSFGRSSAMNPANQRILQLTFAKCGSQWVRDVLTAPEIAECSGVRLDGRSTSLAKDRWPEQEPGTFLGPLYDAHPDDWKAHRQPQDKALVILRDPRDRLVSWVHSVSYSHVPKPAVRLVRDIVFPLDERTRLLAGIWEFLYLSSRFEAWADLGGDAQTLVTKYETIIADQAEQFGAVVGFFGWDVPQATLNAVIHRLSFAKRSGRAPGQEDVHSHYRKGVAGDWRHHFDRELGQRWEELLPNLLTRLGYETDNHWFESLPETNAPPEREQSADPRLHELSAELARMREARDHFEQLARRAGEGSEKRLKAQRKAAAGRMRRLRKVLRALKRKRVMRWMRRLEKWRRGLGRTTR